MLRNCLRVVRSVAVLAITCGANHAVAQQPLCDLEQGYSADVFESVTGTGKQAEDSLRVLEEYTKFSNSREWKKDVPMGDQMTTQEAVTFGELRQKLIAQQLLGLHYSKRERDLRVEHVMAVMADKAARYGFEVPKDPKSEEFIAGGLLLSAREIIKLESNKRNSPPPDGACTFERSLLNAAFDSYAEAEKIPGAEEALKFFNFAAQKYGFPVDEKKMTADEREKYAVAQPIAKKVLSRVELSDDFRRLAYLERTSKLLFASWLHDHARAPGDMKYVGTTAQEWLTTGKLEKRQEVVVRFLGVLNEQIPSDLIRDMPDIGASSKK